MPLPIFAWKQNPLVSPDCNAMSLCPGSTTETGSCEYDLSSLSPVAAITGYENLPPNDQEAVMSHLANVTTSWCNATSLM